MKVKAAQLREMTGEELSAKKKALHKALFDLRYQAKTGRVDKPHRMRQVKREIAQIETVTRERIIKKEPS